jgi:Secretion system C-terminal sorting domain
VALQIPHTDQENIGIRAPYKNPSPIISLNDLSFLNKAISTHSSGGIEIVDNTFADNYKAISFTNPSTLTSVKFNCNVFSLNILEPFDRFGLYIENGADIFTDFGGNNGLLSPGTIPSGNNWPVNPDPNISIGYPTQGGPIANPFYPAVAEFWVSPLNWYSIFDEIAFSSGEDPVGYLYFAYFNEFVGENIFDPTDPNDAVVPTSVVFRVDDINSQNLQWPDYLGITGSTCYNNPQISFPAERIGNIGLSNIETENSILLEVSPNPTHGFIKIKYNNLDAGNLDAGTIILTDLKGKIVRKIAIIEPANEVELNLNDLPTGIYFLNVVLDSGKRKFLKILKID